MDATPLVIATILVEIPTTLAVVLSGLSSFYAVAAETEAVSATLAAITMAVVTVFGFLSFYAAAVTETLSAKIQTLNNDILILSLRRSLSAAVYFSCPELLFCLCRLVFYPFPFD